MEKIVPIVDARPSLVRRVQRRIAVVAIVGGGVATAAYTLLPAAPVVPPTDPLACPALDPSADVDTGATLTAEQIAEFAGTDTRALVVVAGSHTPQLAILHEGDVQVSDDDGKTLRRAFIDQHVEQIAIDTEGHLYARAGDRLGMRSPLGTETWRDVPLGTCTDECADRFGVIDKTLVWIRDHETVATSDDRGVSWRLLVKEQRRWSTATTELRMFAWRGALYQVNADTVADSTEVHRLDLASRTVAQTTFHTYHDASQPELLAKLVAADDVATTWRWKELCHRDYGHHEPCAENDPARSAMLAARSLLPATGARTLAVHAGGLVEVCPGGGRLVYRAFPFATVDAVDRAGRPLVVVDRTLVRWSPQHGWRRIFRVPADPGDGEH